MTVEIRYQDQEIQTGNYYYYARVIQEREDEDNYSGIAVTSPIWITMKKQRRAFMEFFRNYLSDFQKQEVELQISWNGGSTRGTIVRVCKDCILVASIGTESGYVHVIPLENIMSVRVDSSDQARALMESKEAETSAPEKLNLGDDSARPITIKPLN
jgi:hypothetical protein